MRLTHLAHAVFLLVLASNASAATPVETEVVNLIEEYNNQLRALGPRLAAAKTNEEREAIRAAAPSAGQYSPRLMKIAEANLDDPGAVKAACWLATQANGTAESPQALALLGGRLAGRPGVWEAAQQLYRIPREQSEPVLRAILKVNTHPEDQCAATHALATVLFNVSENAATPELKAAREEARQLFQKVVTDFPSVTIQGFKPADQCAAILFEMENLAVGCVAPEIEGKDADGAAFKLGDFRGKVVVLVFWGAWCHSCHHFLPQLRELHAKLQDRPAAIVGVNSDLLTELKPFLAAEKLPWRNFADESSTGPISSVWNIRNWPTIYLIDAKGVIQAKNPSVGALEEMIRPLLAAPSK